MKIAIISDTHDNLPNMEKAFGWMKNNGIREIIHCGDVCAPSVMGWLAQQWGGPIHLVFGNVDGDQAKMKELAQTKCSNVKIYGEKGELEIDQKRIAFTHHPEDAEKLAQTGQYDYVFYGHTHKPWQEAVGRTQMVNPGTLAGLFYKATFAVLDLETGKLELKILERI